MLNTDALLRIIEGFAEGSFEELFDYEWTDAESFIQAGCDYVPFKNQAAFAAAVRAAVK